MSNVTTGMIMQVGSSSADFGALAADYIDSTSKASLTRIEAPSEWRDVFLSSAYGRSIRDAYGAASKLLDTNGNDCAATFAATGNHILPFIGGSVSSNNQFGNSASVGISINTSGQLYRTSAAGTVLHTELIGSNATASDYEVRIIQTTGDSVSGVSSSWRSLTLGAGCSLTASRGQVLYARVSVQVRRAGRSEYIAATYSFSAQAGTPI